MRATHLRTAYLKNPVGIDEVLPRLSWKACDGKLQSAYEIRTKKNGREDWGSGVVETGSMCAKYQGKAGSRDMVSWQIRLYDESGAAGPWSEEAFFEIGLIKEEDWKAAWVSGQDTDKEERLSADYYEICFSLEILDPDGKQPVEGKPVKEVQKARLYATACGIYEAFVNGKRVGDQVLAPGCTQYDKRLYYQTYDVTRLLRPGRNRLNFVVGDGWYKGKLGCDGEEYLFGSQTALLGQLEIVYIDGSVQTVVTDENAGWSNHGPVGYNDLKDGIRIDENRVPVYNRKARLAAVERIPTASNGPAIREHEYFHPTLLVTPSGKTVLDFGQNMAGYVKYTGFLGKGQTLSVWLGETLDNGEFTQENFATLPNRGKSIDQKIEIVGCGEKVKDYPKFFYSGFRYALVEGLKEVNPSDFAAAAVYSDLSFGGEFLCSNEAVNRYVRNTIWSEKSNFVDIPTDCPQREKGGWTGDAQVFASTALYLSDASAFYRKWLRDVKDCQREDGRVDNVCPKVERLGQQDVMNGAVGWADAAVIIPYLLWKTYGDFSFIQDNYELMHGWKEYVMAAAKDKGYYHLPEDFPIKAMIAPFLVGESPYSDYIVESGCHWGEWCEPEGVLEVDAMTELLRPKAEENLAYMHFSMGLLAEMLEAVGRQTEAAQCRKYCEKAKEAYQYHFVKDHDIASARQSKLVRPLALGLLDGETAENVAARLNQTAIDREYKIGTGFLSTPFILQVLSDYGYTDTAYRILENQEEPGWLAMVKQGATTIWEHYNGYDENGHPLDTSFNHYSAGAVCGFLFSYTAGIRLEGERSFIFKPVPGGTLTHAGAVWDSPYGTVKARWKLEERRPEEKGGVRFSYSVELPANCRGKVELPDGQLYEIGPGKRTFIC